MTQNRKAPAFQEYAASMLASMSFRLMSLQERGLFYTMRLECWENIQLPAPVHKLAKFLYCDVDHIQKALTDEVKSFFIEKDGFYTCPELDNYRKHLEERKAKQSQGGKQGAAMTNAKVNKPRKATNTSDSGKSSSNSQVPHRVGIESLVQSSTLKKSQIQSLEKEIISDEFVTEYEAAESVTANDYSKASGR